MAWNRLRADRVLVIESELRGVAIDAGDAPGLRISDAILRACDLSNVDGREGSLRRIEIHGSRLLGFGLAGGTVQDPRILDSSLALTSLAFAKLKDVIFERVDLAEASFMLSLSTSCLSTASSPAPTFAGSS
jgi:uncharacterized protein YjbI with pentapeptide repeats